MIERDYLSGNLSVLRNPILGNVLFRLNIIEQFGTVIRRIKRCYEEGDAKPQFTVTDGSITVTLPVVDIAPELDADERTVRALFAPGRVLSSAQVSVATGFGKDKCLRLLGQLSDKGLVRVQGAGRATRYVMN
jgi:ATP-dependent DNA helicase RecG